MTTANYGFELPSVGGDVDAWGGLLNSNWTAVDALIKSLSDTVAALEASALIPVGGLYLSTTDTDPATTLGYGTWVAHAAGRALIGVGDNTESVWTVDQERGSEEHTLLDTEMPSHVHNVDPPLANTSTNGLHNHGPSEGGSFFTDKTAGESVSQSGDNSENRDARTTTDGAHSHTVEIAAFDSAAAGGGAPHNNVQPSIAVYVWKRTV